MILYLAGGYWLILWLVAPPNSESQIKRSYPRIGAIEDLRESFLARLTGLSPDAEALVAGLTIGERDLVSEELQQQMRDLSLTHLVAVSGANLAIVLGSVYFLTAAIGLRRNLRFLLALLLMLAYVLLVGPESSVIRAATMALFVMLGIWLGRGTNPIYPLSAAVFFLLLLDPGLAVDVGFGLSAFATAGLVALTPKIYQKLEPKLGKLLAAAVAATSAAQLYTLPIILYLQPSLPMYSILANLLVEAAVAPITILGLLSVITATLAPLLSVMFSFLASIGAQWIVNVSQFLSQMPLVRLHFLPGAWGIAAAFGFAVLISLYLVSSRFRTIGKWGSAILLIVVGSWIATDLVRHKTFAGEWEIYACDVGQGDAVLIRSEGQTALIDVGKDDEAIAKCLDDANVQKIDLLILSHYDLDHVGGLGGVIGKIQGPVFVSPFRDSRQIVDQTKTQLAALGLPVKLGHQGLHGKLGSISWFILSPSPAASEASDSNDASISMVFDFGEFVYLTLGDLGEDGQKRLSRTHPSLLAELSERELVVKVAHHGSADQSADFYKSLNLDLGLFLVGQNRYGHPTRSALQLMQPRGVVLRTDQHGPIAISFDTELRYRVGGKLTA